MDYKHNKCTINVFLPETQQDLFTPGEFINSNGLKCVSVSWSAPLIKPEPQDYVQEPTAVLIPKEKIKTEVKQEPSDCLQEPTTKTLSEVKQEGEHEKSIQPEGGAEPSAAGFTVIRAQAAAAPKPDLQRPVLNSIQFPVQPRYNPISYTAPATSRREVVHVPILFLQDHSYIRPQMVLKQLCPVCNEAFATIAAFEEHKLSHFKCHTCNMLFLEEHAFRLHNAGHMKQIPCPVCKKMCATRATLKAHQASHFKCAFCSNYFLHEGPYIRHLKEHPGLDAGKMYPQCPLCKMRFITEAAFEEHKKSHFNCTRCNILFLDRFSYIQHKMEHMTTKKNGTAGAKWNFEFVRSYQPIPDVLKRCMNETKKNPGQHQFKCPLCKATFVKPVFLHAHLRLNHNELCD